MTRANFFTLAAVVTLALGLSLSVTAGSIDDSDGDLIPDVFDNCSIDANGPGDASNQVDTDADGFGNACDCDFDNNNDVNGIDIVDMFGVFLVLPVSELHDIDGNGDVNGIDVVNCFGRFLQPPGPGSTAI